MPKEPTSQNSASPPKVGWLLGLLAATAWAAAAWGYHLELPGLAVWCVFLLGCAAFAGMLLSGWILRIAPGEGGPATWTEVLEQEAERIKAARDPSEKDSDRAPSRYVGLALSGGGIRSATFNLGLLQALAELRLLSRIDYLSTVSGGGYIGSWLMQWARNAEPEAPTEARASAHETGGAPVPEGERPDAQLAAMLYVAWADGGLSSTDRSVLEATCGSSSEGPSIESDEKQLEQMREPWLAIATAAEDQSGQRLDPHQREGIASCARRIVDAHRNFLETENARPEKDQEELAKHREALAAKQAALDEIETALELRGVDTKLAAMLYVASADGRLSGTDRSVLEASCGSSSEGLSLERVQKQLEPIREHWLAIATAAEDQRGRRLGPHERAGIASCARRIVNAHRNFLETESARPEKDQEELAKHREALEAKQSALAEIETALDLRGIDKIQHALADEASVDAPEPRPVSHLREFSNYLTPQVGLLTADTWTTVATYVRNFAINLVLITATVSLVLLLPRLIRRVVASVDAGFDRLADRWGALGGWIADYWSLELAVLSATFAVLGIALSLRRAALDEDHGQAKGRSQGDIQKFIVAPLAFAALCAAHWLARDAGGELTWKQWAAATAAAYALPWLLFGWVAALLGGAGEGRNKDRWTLANSVLALAGLAVGATVGIAAFALKQAWSGGAIGGWGLLTIGPPAVMLAFTLSAVLLIGLAGRRLDDYLREWLARVGAWISIYSLGWLALVGLATYGPVLLAAAESWGRWLLASGWLAASIGGVLAGNAQQHGTQGRWQGPVVRFAPWIFILGLVLSLTWALDAGLSRRNGETQKAWAAFHEAAKTRETTEVLDYKRDGSRLLVERSESPSTGWFRNLRQKHEQLLDLQLGITTNEHAAEVLEPRSWFWLGGWLVGLGLIAGLFGWRVDINEFSMHNYYRNRLVRAYLGASNPNRPNRTQPFTGMARSDDTPLGLDQVLRPYHLVNTALNLVGGNRLAWQQRKAASFVLSPLYSGFELPPSESTYSREAAFRKTSHLAELSLGTALAISGAAASPNMGFRSSPALTLLLTVFNVRLGWWLGNPKGPSWYRTTPRFALAPLLSELFGLTSLDSKYVYLSDGGHFENLGIYELVRRRCRFIIASDVGADPAMAFEDLGNAVRKCRRDFGAKIEIDVGALAPDASGICGRHCAVGKITYAAEKDGGLRDRGWLLYIKSSLTGDEPEDVLQYKMANDAFPHQSTADQFFDESQFESYRELGRHVGRRVFESATSDLEKRFENWYSLFEDLQRRWYAPSALVERSFTKHGQALNRLFERLGTDRNLEFLDSQIYKELGSSLSRSPRDAPLPKRRRERRAGFYFCSSLLQLMENVYLDLDLDDEQEHPDNRGWLRLFERWAQVPMVVATWAVTADSYGSRFRSFCERRLELPLSEVEIGAQLDESTVQELIKSLRRIGKDIEAKGKKVTWHELVAVAPGLRFPIGRVVLLNEAEYSQLIYYEVEENLRSTGLAQRGLQALEKHLDKKGKELGGGPLELVDRDYRLPSISAARWNAFEHFFYGALGGSDR